MHVEFEVSWWSAKLWLRRRWRRTLIRLHLRKPYDGPNYVQMFDTIKLTNEKLVGKLYELTPPEAPFLWGWTPDDLRDLSDQADS